MNLTELSDEELLSLPNPEREMAIAIIYNRYKVKASKFYYRMILNAGIPKVSYDDCEDIYNELIFRTISKYNESRGHFATFLKRVIRYDATNFIRDHFRKDLLAYSSSMEKELAEGLTMHDVLSSNDGFHCSLDSIMMSPKAKLGTKLKTTQTKVIGLKGLGFSVREIAKVCKLSVSSVSRILKNSKNVNIDISGDLEMD